jgi:hypothetical protein
MKRNIPAVAAASVFALHAIANPHYGFFRDELYFIICGRHPQLGYVDQPPVIPLLSAATQVFGPSLFLLRLIPAAFAGAGAYVTCLLAAEFGGGAFALALAAIVYFFTGVLTSFGMKVSPDTVGLLTWPLVALLVTRIAKGADPRLWLAAGAAAGVSIESKYSVLFFLAALFAGLIATPQRTILFNRWFAYGTLLTLVIALPNFAWQWHYGFPMIELLRAGQNGKNVVAGPATFVFQEIVITGLFLAVVWIAGLIWLLRTPLFRFLGYAYVVLIAAMIVFHGKHYYPADVYPILIAAGAVPIETWTQKSRALRVAAAAYAIVSGLLFVPFALPVLPEATFVAYQDRVQSVLHISSKSVATEHNRENSALPGDWADMHGWPQLAATVARVYRGLPESDRARAVIVASNYGEAAAIDFFGTQYHLPPALSGHNQYFLWGTHGYSGDVLIDVGGDCGAKDRLFRESQRAATFSAPYAISYENHLPIMLCRGIKKPLAEIWPAVKAYI